MAENHFSEVLTWLGITAPPRAPVDLIDRSDPEDAWLEKVIRGSMWGDVRPLILPRSPDVLHAQNRGRLFLRHSRPTMDDGARYVREALARTYPTLSREFRLMRLLRYHRLDNDFWRMIYALMVAGGPVLRGEMVRVVYRLSRRDLADGEAERLYAAWDRAISPRGADAEAIHG